MDKKQEITKYKRKNVNGGGIRERKERKCSIRVGEKIEDNKSV